MVIKKSFLKSWLCLLFCSSFFLEVYSQTNKPPLVEKYSTENRVRSGVALGGIGAGYVELRKDGQFYNWSIFNNAPLGSGPVFQLPTWPRNGAEQSLMFFLVRYKEEGKDEKIKILQINNSLDEGGLEGIDYYFPWMSAVKNIEYSGRFPFVNMKFSDPEMPFVINMEAFSPFIPHDVKNSTLPGIYFDFKISSTTDKPVNVMLIGSQRNLTGYDEFNKYFTSDLVEKDKYKFFSQSADGMDKASPTYGNMGMASVSGESSYYIGWEHKHPYYERLLEFNKFPNKVDTDSRNSIDKKTGKKIANSGYKVKDQRMFSSIAVTKDLKKGESFEHTFVMTWFFPNSYGSHNDESKGDFSGNYSAGQKLTKNQGHYYQNSFSNSAEVADYMIQEKENLTKKTKKFVNDFYASTVDQFVLDQVNSQLNTFITSSVLTKDGKFGLREGMTPDKSWGPNTTIDVSLYGSVAVAALFPELQKSAMKCHRNIQTPNGEIAHGLGFDLDFTQNGTWGVYERIDLPANYVQIVLRDYFWMNDKAYLKEMWPSVKKAIEYILTKRDEDGNQMPDMEGIMCSYDNFPMYGLASYIQSQWLTALAGAVEAAKVMGDKEAEVKYATIFKKGSELMDKHLWNGKYYRLSNDYMNKHQKGVDEGCLTDQVIGQWMANQTGLGYIINPNNVKKSLQSIYQMSYKEGFGLRNCSWPEHPVRFPIHESDLWVDQANTPWTGVELAFASFMIYEGFYKEGLNIIKSVDDRYRKAGLYWDHQEFGGHYYRPMSAWAIVNSLLGLSINQGTYSFAPKLPQKEYTMFFATPEGTAHFIVGDNKVEVKVLSGKLNIQNLNLENINFPIKKAYLNGKSVGTVKMASNKYTFDFKKITSIGEGQSLVLK